MLILQNRRTLLCLKKYSEMTQKGGKAVRFVSTDKRHRRLRTGVSKVADRYLQMPSKLSCLADNNKKRKRMDILEDQ